MQSAGSEKIEHYMQFAHSVGSAKLEFPGPFGGYTFVHFHVKEVNDNGDTLVKDHPFLLDLNLSHDGTFLAPDTLKSFSDMLPFEFELQNHKIIHAKLAPTHSREELRGFDSAFHGSIGYGLLRSFVTVFDFKKNTLTFYPLFANVSIADNDPNTIQLPLLDDAYLTYCHCPYPTIWLEAQAPPLQAGRVQLAFQQPISQVFTNALDAKTKKIVDKESTADPITGKKEKVGLTLAEFRIGGENLAGRSPRRAVDAPPEAFHDLSVKILGTLGTDVLRTFSGLIIDPSRNKIILVR
jgi:hypothetical protein